MIPNRSYTAADILQMARRRAQPMAAVFLGTALVTTFAAVSFSRAVYRSEAVILVDTTSVAQNVVPAAVNIRIEEEIRNVSQQLMSRTTLERLIREFGLYGHSGPVVPEEIVADMRSDMTLEVVKANAFRVSYVAPDPHLAQKVTERLAGIIVNEYARQRTDFAIDVNRFLDAQLSATRAQLADQESRLDSYRRRHAGELPSEVQTNLVALGTVQTQAQALAESLGRDHDRLELLRRAASPATAATATSAGDPQTDQLTSARADLGEMLRRLTPEHPDVVRQQRVIRDLEQTIAHRRQAGALDGVTLQRPVVEASADAKTEMASLQERIAAREAEYQRLLDSIAALKARVDAAPTHEAELAALMRDYDTLQKVYAALLTKAEESKLAASLERRQVDQRFRLLDPARLPEQPFGLHRIRLLLAAVLGAVGLALCAGLLLEVRDTSIHDEEDVKVAIDLPLLAVVSEIEVPGTQRRRALAAAIGLAGATVRVLLLAWLHYR